jgi:kynureninase
VLSLAALECGVDTLLAAQPYGGMPALRRKSIALTQSFVECVEERCAGLGLTLRSPRDGERRGAQVSYGFAGDGYAVVQALIARGVVGDFRAPDLLRFGLAPLYTRFVDVFDAVEALRDVLANQAWRSHAAGARRAVT